MRTVLIILGAASLLIGPAWMAYGLNVIGDSPISGDVTWAIIGAMVTALGLLLLLVGLSSVGSR